MFSFFHATLQYPPTCSTFHVILKQISFPIFLNFLQIASHISVNRECPLFRCGCQRALIMYTRAVIRMVSIKRFQIFSQTSPVFFLFSRGFLIKNQRKRNKNDKNALKCLNFQVCRQNQTNRWSAIVIRFSAHHLFMRCLYHAKHDPTMKFDVKTTNVNKTSQEFKNTGLRRMPGISAEESGETQTFETEDDILDFLEYLKPERGDDEEAENATCDLFRQFARFVKDVEHRDTVKG